MYDPEQKYLHDGRSGGWPGRGRWLPIFCAFALLASSAAQDIGGNAGTNRPVAAPASTNLPPPVSTNLPPPVQNIEPTLPPPGVAEQLEAQNPLTNEVAPLPSPPPPIGTSAVGSVQSATPFMGRSVVSEGPNGFASIPLGAGLPLWGPVDIHPHLVDSLTYGDGIQARPGQSSKTGITTINPGFLLDIGKNVTLDYGPAFAYYSNPQFKNTTSEYVTLHGGWSNEDWDLGLTQSYISSSDPLVETGVQTAQEAYVTGLTAIHPVSSEVTLQLALNQNIRSAQSLTELHEWTTSDWLNYQPAQAFGGGIGVILGYDKVDPGSDMPFEQIQAKINFHLGTKLTLVVSGGGEDRQFLGPSAPPLISPVFNGSILYQIFRPTVLTFTASQVVTPSLFANQVETITIFSAQFRQQLSKKIFLDGSASYSSEPETAIEPAPLPQFFIGTPPVSTLVQVRNDSTTSFRASLSYNVVERISFSMFYSVSDISSGQANFAYWNHQVGLSLNYRY